jgi:hypothetical protein
MMQMNDDDEQQNVNEQQEEIIDDENEQQNQSENDENDNVEEEEEEEEDVEHSSTPTGEMDTTINQSTEEYTSQTEQIVDLDANDEQGEEQDETSTDDIVLQQFNNAPMDKSMCHIQQQTHSINISTRE